MNTEYDLSVDPKKGESQYNDYDLEKVRIVPARYVPALLESYRGNIFIEALPSPRLKENICNEYFKPLLTYDENKIPDMARYEKLLNIKTIRDLRLPLPFCYDLETEFNAALVASYSSRELMEDESIDLDCHVGGQNMVQHSILAGNPAASSTGYFSLLGISGSGKSSMIHMLLSRYPQVIVHELGSNHREIQVVYLVVNCTANSSFHALYCAMGHALDLALKNINGRCEREIAKQRSISQKAAQVEKFIEQYKIGAIILDEVQELSFDTTRESSFNSLLTLVNNTKVALISVGTEEAYDKMYSSLRLCRRGGNNICAHSYCNFRKGKTIDRNDFNERYFRTLLNLVFKYQWFDKRVEVTDDIVDAFYDATRGIIDQIIYLYIWVSVEYLSDTYADKKPVVDGNFIKQVAKKHCGKVKKYIDDLDLYIRGGGIVGSEEIRAESEAKIDEMIQQAKTEALTKQFIDSEDSFEDNMINLNVVTRELTSSALFDYTLEEIAAAFKKVMGNKGSKGKELREILQLVVAQMNRTRKMSSNVEKKDKGSMKAGVVFTRETGLNFLGLSEGDKDAG